MWAPVMPLLCKSCPYSVWHLACTSVCHHHYKQHCCWQCHLLTSCCMVSCDPQVTFQLTSESTPWITRTYKSLSQAAKESADSRQYAGVHFPSANYDGLKLGKLVASKVYDRIQPKQAVVTQQRKVAKGAPAVVSTEAGPKAAATGRRRLRWL